ncbi:MAG: hypothetical protein R2749_17560 [Acidimicrobiales bacterium]
MPAEEGEERLDVVGIEHRGVDDAPQQRTFVEAVAQQHTDLSRAAGRRRR